MAIPLDAVSLIAEFGGPIVYAKLSMTSVSYHQRFRHEVDISMSQLDYNPEDEIDRAAYMTQQFYMGRFIVGMTRCVPLERLCENMVIQWGTNRQSKTDLDTAILLYNRCYHNKSFQLLDAMNPDSFIDSEFWYRFVLQWMSMFLRAHPTHESMTNYDPHDSYRGCLYFLEQHECFESERERYLASRPNLQYQGLSPRDYLHVVNATLEKTPQYIEKRGETRIFKFAYQYLNYNGRKMSKLEDQVYKLRLRDINDPSTLRRDRPLLWAFHVINHRLPEMDRGLKIVEEYLTSSEQRSPDGHGCEASFVGLLSRRAIETLIDIESLSELPRWSLMCSREIRDSRCLHSSIGIGSYKEIVCSLCAAHHESDEQISSFFKLRSNGIRQLWTHGHIRVVDWLIKEYRRDLDEAAPVNEAIWSSIETVAADALKDRSSVGLSELTMIRAYLDLPLQLSSSISNETLKEMISLAITSNSKRVLRQLRPLVEPALLERGAAISSRCDKYTQEIAGMQGEITKLHEEIAILQRRLGPLLIRQHELQSQHDTLLQPPKEELQQPMMQMYGSMPFISTQTSSECSKPTCDRFRPQMIARVYDLVLRSCFAPEEKTLIEIIDRLL